MINESKAREDQVNQVKDKMQQEIGKCVTKHTFANLEQSLKGFINIQDFIDFRNEVYPVFEEFKNRFQDMKDNNEEMKSCIRGFDETICEKASKMTVYDLEKRICEDFVTKVDYKMMSDNLMELEQERLRVSQMMKEEALEFQDTLKDKIRNICKEIITEKLGLYDKITKSFSKFFSSDELDEVISRKADIELL